MRYVLNFDKPTIVTHGEIECILPTMPPLEEMINYGLDIKEQKFKRLPVPTGNKWAKMSLRERVKFVEHDWHRRKNGEWWLIKNVPIYITGPNLFFLDRWTTQSGMPPEFRISQVNVFQVWFHISRAPKCCGLFVLKGRRAYLTEVRLAISLELVTRKTNRLIGMQNQDESAVERDYKRIIDAYLKLPRHFKPINQGGRDPKSGLSFRYPTNKNVIADIVNEYQLTELEIQQIAYLNSSVTFETTKTGKYDGERLAIYNGGEWGKIDPKTMDVRKQLNVIRPTLFRDKTDKKLGNMFIETSIEEVGENLEVVSDIWSDSNPLELQDGKTITMLYRLFIPMHTIGKPDEWGFVDEKAEWQKLEDELQRLLKAGKSKEAAQWRRQNARCIEDALTPSPEASPLDTEAIAARQYQLNMELDWRNQPFTEDGIPVKSKIVRGDFVRPNGIDSPPAFLIRESGKFYMSEPPSKINNFIIQDGLKSPANSHVYVIGVDPVEHGNVQRQDKASMFSIACFKKLNEALDGNKITVNEEGEKEYTDFNNWKSNYFVLDLACREEAPQTSYEDALMAAEYFGCQLLIESNKKGFIDYCNRRGRKNYVMIRPNYTGIGSTDEQGIPSSTQTIELLISQLKQYTHYFCPLVNHPNILNDWALFTGTKANRTKRDLSMASGWALVGANEKPEEPRRTYSMGQLYRGL